MYQRKNDEGVQSSSADYIWPVLNSTTRSNKRMQVQILGSSEQQDHFLSILAANVQQWGYEASILPAGAVGGGNGRESEREADVLLYDLDTPLHRATKTVSKTGGDTSFASPYLTDADKGGPRARLMIALCSHSVSRFTLEQIGAVALLYKPFQMERLQRYLQVFQQVLSDEPESSSADTSPWAPESLVGQGNGAHRGAGRPTRILVVEDHPRVAETIQQCLEFEPRYDIRIAQDGLDALEQCAAWRPHCIVTDLLLPYMDGYQIMRALSASTRRRMPAFVVISALTQHELPESHVYPHQESVVFIDKPFQVENLLDAVEQALSFFVKGLPGNT
jgi:CheY-like chemotaxis protein